MSDQMPPIDEIFDEAIRRRPGDDRQQYLAEICGENADLRQRVDRLLRAVADAGTFLEAPAAAAPLAATIIDTAVTEMVGDTIGPYRLLQQIGEGGMGVVYMAEQTQPVERRVALKVIKPGMDTNEVIARFEAERQALAMMNHPHIARVFDAGMTDSRRPYFVMELINGISITDYCDEQQLTAAERLKLFLPVCQAVQHAHQKGVIHRDLKPSNILVAEYDHLAVPKIIDFGVAKAISQHLTERTLFTQLGQVMGTIEYMSPEQAKRNQLDVDTRSDIYSLGVILYELLTGETPFDKRRLRSAAFDEVLKIIREEDPPRPSTRISSSVSLPSIAANRRIEPARLSRFVRGDLDWIVMKLLEKDRNRRYATASALAEDIQSFLDDEPVKASPPSAAYRLRKFAKRHTTAIVMAGVISVLLVVGTIVSAWQAVRATRAEKNAVEQAQAAIRSREDAEQARDLADSARRDAEQQQKVAEAERRRAEVRELEVRRGRYQINLNLAREAWGRSDIASVLSHLEEEIPDPGTTDLRSVGWYYFWNQCHRELQTFREHSGDVWQVAVSPDGHSIASAGKDHSVKVRDVASGRVRLTLSGHNHEVNAVSWSPDGTQIASASDDETIRLWDAETGEPQGVLPGHRGNVRAVVYSPDGTQIATGGTDTEIRLWDTRTHEEIGVLRGHAAEINELAFSADGDLLVSCGDEDNIRLWDVRSMQQRIPFSGHDGHVHSVAFSPQGDRLASAAMDGKVILWDVRSGNRIAMLPHRGSTQSVRFSSDGSFIVTGETNGSINVWDAEIFQKVQTINGHRSIVRSVSVTPDCQYIVSGSSDGMVTLWEAPRPEKYILRGHDTWPYAVAISPDGHTVASGGGDGIIKLWEAETGRLFAELKPEEPVMHLTFSPDGNTLASAWRSICLWNLDTRAVRLKLSGHTGTVQDLEFSADGRRLVSCGDDHNVRLWDLESGHEEATFAGHTRQVDAVRFFPGALRLASGSRDQTIRIWDVKSQKQLAVYSGNEGSIRGLSVSPDGRTIAAGTGMGGVINLWDEASGKIRAKLRGHSASVESVTYSTDGSFLVSAGNDSTVKLWDAASAQVIATFTGHTDQIDNLSLSRDGRKVVTGGKDKMVRIWDIDVTPTSHSAP